MALIGEDCSISMRFGTVVAGVITWGSSVPFTAKAKRISVEDSVELANTKAIGDARKKHRAHSGSTRVDLENVVGYGGYGFINSGTRATPISLACELTIKELSSLTTGSVWTGIIEKWKGDIQSTEVQIESMSIMCDIDAA